MAVPLNQVFFPSGFQELFTAWNRFPGAAPFAGGTGFIRGQGRPILSLPSVILSLDKMEEMHRITRTERYLEIGAMVPLNRIIRLGKIVPEVLTLCLEKISGIQLRNIATIGGNICFPARRLDASAPLAALDAHYELRSAQNSRWISASRFSSLPGPTALKPQELLTRIRIPLDQWNYSIYKKFADSSPETSGGAVVFIVKTQKSTLIDIKVVFKTDTILRDKNSEAILAGKQLPLNRRDVLDFLENWNNFLSSIANLSDLTRTELMNFIEFNIYNLTE
jgi:CO/xanthine dehydrogenase FAD-binding subunit